MQDVFGDGQEAQYRNVGWRYERRLPEQTLLYRLVAEHYPRFIGLC